MSTATFHQATHTLTIIGQQEPTNEQLRVLHDGYLSDLVLGIKEGTMPPRDDFRKLLGLPPVELITEIDFGQTLEHMIAAGKYDWQSEYVTANKLPVGGRGKKTFRNKLFYFGHDISSGGAVAVIEKQKFVPATHVHGLAFGATFPDEQRKYPIIFLGSSAQVNGDRNVVGLSRNDNGRNLSLYGWDGDWHDHYRFLGVQEVSGT